jgi:hypothetical protein
MTEPIDFAKRKEDNEIRERLTDLMEAYPDFALIYEQILARSSPEQRTRILAILRQADEEEDDDYSGGES